MNKDICPLCSSRRIRDFYSQKGIPVLNNVIYSNKKDAIDCKKDEVVLSFCANCEFIFSSTFNKTLLKYDQSYDNDRSASSYYSASEERLVDILIHKYKISNTRILEIGCGNGKFLKEICAHSHSSGIGVDPAYNGKTKDASVTFIQDYFSDKYVPSADVCIMRCLLEHIEHPSEFIASIIRNVEFMDELTFVVEVPDFKWIAKEGLCWDITYEHCAYFTERSLRNLFSLNGIIIREIVRVFGNQYLLAIGSIKKGKKSENRILSGRSKLMSDFLTHVKERKQAVAQILKNMNGPYIIWGMGGKGVLFLNMLPKHILDTIPFVIDLNRQKQDTYCPGTGLKIMPPEILKTNPIRNILVMNPNYKDEIATLLKTIGNNFHLLTL